MNDLGTNISLYADDAVLYSSDDNHSRLKSHLETLLMAINNWSKLNYINLNVQKTKFCIYSYRSHIKKFQDTTLKACDQEIFRCHQGPSINDVMQQGGRGGSSIHDQA